MKKLYLACDSECGVFAIYNQEKKLVLSWQEGDDITRVLKGLFKNLGVEFETKSFSVDGFIPDTI